MKLLSYSYARLLGLVATSLFVTVASSHAQVIVLGNSATDRGTSDGSPPLVLMANSQIPGPGAIIGGSVYVGSQSEGVEGTPFNVNFEFLLLKPVGANNTPGGDTTFTVEDHFTVSGASSIGAHSYTFTTPWDVTSDEVLAYYGTGASYGPGNTGLFYANNNFSANPPPADGSNFTVYPTDADGAPFYHGSRDYSVNFNYSTPEPSTWALMVMAGVCLVLYRRRSLQ